MPAPPAVHRRVPYISGGTKGRDHYQFRRYGPDDPFPFGPALPPTSNPPFYHELDLDKAMKWLWRVREWSVSGSYAFNQGTIYNNFGFCSGTKGVDAAGSGSVSFALKQYRKTGPLGIEGYTGAVDPQILMTEEHQLLDSFRDSDLFALFSLGNFGFVPDWDTFGMGAGYPNFGPVVVPVSTSFTDPHDHHPGVDCDLDINTISHSSDLLINIMRWDPPVPSTKDNPVRQDQLLWNPGTQKVKVPIYFNLSVGVVATVTAAGDPNPADVQIKSFGVNADVSGSDFTNTLTIDGEVFALHISGAPFLGLPGTANFTVTPTKFWPFVNRLGQPVYDESSGAQINDPLA